MRLVLSKIKGHGILRSRAFLKVIAATFIAVIVVCSIVITSYSEGVNKGLSDNLIRLHVVANSDSPEDQALKRDIRDIIIKHMENELKDSKDIEETKYLINMNMNKIQELARIEILRQEKDYSVKATLGIYPFPTKLYGDITLPAGKYQALKVEIGKGEGANWWCVLFPPLCFVDASHGTIPENVKKDLKNVLSEEEYKIITSTDEEDELPVKVKFKVVEIFQSSKLKFSGMISYLTK